MIQKPLIDLTHDGEYNDLPYPLFNQRAEAGSRSRVIRVSPVSERNKRTGVEDDSSRWPTVRAQSSGPLPGPGR